MVKARATKPKFCQQGLSSEIRPLSGVTQNKGTAEVHSFFLASTHSGPKQDSKKVLLRSLPELPGPNCSKLSLKAFDLINTLVLKLSRVNPAKAVHSTMWPSSPPFLDTRGYFPAPLELGGVGNVQTATSRNDVCAILTCNFPYSLPLLQEL